MKITTRMERKVCDYNNLNECVVQKVVHPTAEEYEELFTYPQRPSDFLSQHKKDMFTTPSGEHNCVLFLNPDSNDGILVNSEGTSKALFSAYISGARDIANARIKQTGDQQAVSSPKAGMHPHLKDLMLLGIPDSAYIVHDTIDIGFVSATHLKNLTLHGWEKHERLMEAEVASVRPGAYGPEIVLTNVDAQVLSDFDQAAADHHHKTAHDEPEFATF